MLVRCDPDGLAPDGGVELEIDGPQHFGPIGGSAVPKPRYRPDGAKEHPPKLMKSTWLPSVDLAWQGCIA